VSDIYATGKALSNAGVVPGLDMTTECALTKLAYLLADESLTPDQVRDKMKIPLAGELTRPVVHPIGAISSTLSDTYANLVLTLPLGLRHQYEHIIGTHFFHVAASKDDVRALGKVMNGETNFNIDAIDYQGSTALHVAIYKGSLQATKWLLERGASIYLADCYGRRPLQIAQEVARSDVDYPLEDITNLLYSAGAQ
jgi:lysophospholipase